MSMYHYINEEGIEDKMRSPVVHGIHIPGIADYIKYPDGRVECTSPVVFINEYYLTIKTMDDLIKMFHSHDLSFHLISDERSVRYVE